ncbi:hypothetical protein VST7929_01505 [Vibrio stylophorae]|uniref:DUF218 domain-containing protein n=1 Tax=Vibrio stylophorae TaxID=659351 RepID=A0ABN8DR60_9VIBR|nr:envelope biogenesis factor ElyC [Vibrio stylophorae]CAH0533634.1 hypothetical protein VST7929_01505 [Vibrio stylophorae]
MFELKKILSALLMPLPALLGLALIGLYLIWFTRHANWGRWMLTISWVMLFLLSFQPVSTTLLASQERQYRAFIPDQERIDYVMVLGESHVVDKDIPATSELSRAALMRLIEGIRIYRLYPGSRLVLSGYDGGTEISHARMMAKVALELGVPKSDILLLETAKDTWEEANQAASAIGDAKIVLVTSAVHMERAINEFENAGLHPIPAPTNFLAHKNIKQPWVKYVPKPLYLEQSTTYWYETLGGWWRLLRDNTNPPEAEPVEASQID